MGYISQWNYISGVILSPIKLSEAHRRVLFNLTQVLFYWQLLPAFSLKKEKKKTRDFLLFLDRKNFVIFVQNFFLLKLEKQDIQII